MHDSWIGAPAAAPQSSTGAAEPPAPESVGTFLASQLPLTVGTFATTTAGGLALFFLLLRRRRSEPEVATAAVAASEGRASGPMPAATAEPATDGPIEPIKLNLSPIRELVPPIDPYLLEDPDERLGPSPDEAGIPRWLRPSVRSARMGTLELRQRDWKA
jgi:hypothetical protein